MGHDKEVAEPSFEPQLVQIKTELAVLHVSIPWDTWFVMNKRQRHNHRGTIINKLVGFFIHSRQHAFD